MNESRSPGQLREQITSLMRAERWPAAIKLFKTEMSVVKTDWRLSWDFGWCYFKLERFEEARKHLIRATKLAPENAISKWALGSIYLKLGKFKKAEKYLTESLRIRDSFMTRISLALTCLEQGRTEEAENIHLEGIKLKPKEGRRYESYACFLEDVGREREAQNMYEKAKQLQRIV